MRLRNCAGLSDEIGDEEDGDDFVVAAFPICDSCALLWLLLLAAGRRSFHAAASCTFFTGCAIAQREIKVLERSRREVNVAEIEVTVRRRGRGLDSGAAFL